jgi:hypothetical protein
MKYNLNQRTIRTAGFALSMILGLTVLFVASASAQYRDNRDNRGQERGGYGNQGRGHDDDKYKGNGNGRWNDNDRWNNDNYRYGGYAATREFERRAYRMGIEYGEMDARDGYRYSAEKAAAYAMRRMQMGGYQGSYNRGQMKRLFREAFKRGYSAGYDRYDGYHRGGGRGGYNGGRNY